MKKSKVKIVIGAVLLVFLLAFSGLYYYISTKVTPEEVRKITLEQLQKTFPKAKIELGKIDVSLGFSIKLDIEKLNMTIKRYRKTEDLFSVDDVMVKIPIFSLLTGTGAATIELNKPYISYHEYNKDNNWTYALDSKKTKSKPTKVPKPEKKKKAEKAEKVGKKEQDSKVAMAIPGILMNAKADIKLMDVRLNYSLKDGTDGEVLLQKFLVRNLNFKSPTAFELMSKFKTKINKTDEVSVEALMIGQFSIKEFIEQKTLNSIIVLTLRNIEYPNMSIPDIKTDVNVSLKGNGDIVGDLVTVFGGRNKIAAKYGVYAKKIEVTDIDTALFIKDLLDIVAFNDPTLDATNAKLNLKGSLVMGKKITPTLDLSLSPGIGFKHQQASGVATLKGSYKNSRFKVAVASKVFDGNINANASGKLDINKKIDPFNLAPVKVDIRIGNMNVDKAKIQEILYPPKSDKEKKDKKVAAAAPAGKQQKGKAGKKAAPVAIMLPAMNIALEMEHIKIDNQDFSATAKIVTSRSRAATKYFNFKYADGTGKLTHFSTFKKSGIFSKFNFNLKKLNMAGFSAFLPPSIDKTTGTFNGAVGGSVDLLSSGDLHHDVSVNVDAKDGEIQGLDIGQYVTGIIAKVPVLKKKLGKKKIKQDGNFETLDFKGRFKHAHYNVSKVLFIGVENAVEIKGNGNLYPLSKKRKGIMDFTYVDKTGKISAPMKKYVNTDVLPARLRGIGLDLKPDYVYTAKKLGKAKLKKYIKGEKAQKAKKLIKDKIKNKKINKLLNGLF